MYVGRIAAVARTSSGANAALYRVSSRSFPNRQAVEHAGRLAIVPSKGHEGDLERNPYIAYNCVRIAAEWAVATNGSQTDPIAEKLAAHMPVRDALASVLLALDYEKDDYNTPRIAACVPRAGDAAWLAIVRSDALVIREVPLQAGRAWYIATYEHDDVDAKRSVPFEATTAGEAARYAVDGAGFAALEKPVTAAAAIAAGRDFQLGTYTV